MQGWRAWRDAVLTAVDSVDSILERLEQLESDAREALTQLESLIREAGRAKAPSRLGAWGFLLRRACIAWASLISRFGMAVDCDPDTAGLCRQHLKPEEMPKDCLAPY